jgi:glycine hydroxymethyltransferase
LEAANITCNKNGIPKDPKPPKITSGIRLGTPAATTRGFKETEFKLVGELILETLVGLKDNPTDNSNVEKAVKEKVINLCKEFPIYS